MGSPYLRSGEGIVLSTNRVSVDGLPYNVMLTTQRIFLIDERSARFDPRILPLTMLLSVRSGMTPAYDPVIILLFRTQEGTGKQQPVNLVFSQTRNEDRSAERDDWVRNLIQLSVSHVENESPAEAPAVPEVTRAIGLRPTARHGVAPEKVRPLSNVGTARPAPVPVTIIPDETGGGGEILAHEPVRMPVREERYLPEPVPEGPATDITPLRGTPPPVPAPPARVIIPQIIEELLPVKNTPVPPETQETAPAAAIDPEALFRAIPVAARSMTVTEERTPSVPPAAETIAVPEVNAGPAAAEQEEVPEIIRALHTGATEPDETEPAADNEPVPEPGPEIIRALYTGAVEPGETEPAADGEPVPEPEPEIPQAGIHEIPESHVSLTIPENVLRESTGHPPEAIFQREPAAESIPVRHPIPPAREIRPIRTTLAYAAVLLLLIVLVAAGALLLLPQGPGQTDIPVTPTPGTAQTATILPETVKPASLPPATLSPAPTRITTAVTSIPLSSVPKTGVWVQVDSASNYFGTVGNPDTLQKVSGTGRNFYKVLRSDRTVQVSVQKNDNSGALLAVGIYRNGTLISTKSVTSPMGTVDMLIDPQTGRAPGLTADDSLPEHAAVPSGLVNY